MNAQRNKKETIKDTPSKPKIKEKTEKCNAINYKNKQFWLLL